MKNHILLLFALCLVEFLFSCETKKKPQKPDILAANLDTTVAPGEDFFQYANGGWIKSNPIPPEEASWSIGKVVMNEIYSRVRAINESAVQNLSSDPIQQKVGNFWASGMDTVQIEKDKLTPLQPLLSSIENIKDIQSLLQIVADLKSKGVNCLFSENVFADQKNSIMCAYYLYQGGLGLPNRDYYFNKDERTMRIRKEYVKHIANMFKIAGDDSVKASQRADQVVKLETAMASVSRKLEDLRDPHANYNKFLVSDFNKKTPSINWNEWMKSRNASHVDSVIVGQPEYFIALNNMLKKEPLQNWKNYLIWHSLRSFAPYLHQQILQENFNFYYKQISGIQTNRPRWKRVLDAEEQAIGEAVGQLFVKEYFNEAAKKRYINMVEDIREALKERIQNLDWMSDATKKKALEKLAAMKKKVGYPDVWKDFSSMEIQRGPYVLNIMNAKKWWRSYNLNQIGKPVNYDEWGMTPQTYDAYYSPTINEIVLPAAIFRVPGYRDEELDDALAYGYAASTIGHEITHGFDDRGRKYDGQGNLTEWWTKEDKQKFVQRAEVMVRQYNEFILLDSLHINGEVTLGENIADLGGVILGWEAFKKSDQYKKGESISGLNPSQRYFLGYALGWLSHSRKESLANYVMTNVHSPAKYRVNGSFVNVDDFYSVFNIKSEDKMFRPDSLRVRIW